MNSERGVGIYLKGKIKYPIKIIHARCGIGSYEEEYASETDPEQGWQTNRREEGSLTLCDDCGGW